jgi:hypothetical protein
MELLGPSEGVSPVNFESRVSRRAAGIGIASVVTGGVLNRFAGAQTPEASPGSASPVASPVGYPQGPIGEQLQWLEESLNAEGGVTAEDVTPHFAPDFLETTPAESIAEQITALGAEGGPYAIDTQTMIMTMDFPPTNASFTINGESGGVIHGGMSIDRDSGLIRGFVLEWAPTATPVG